MEQFLVPHGVGYTSSGVEAFPPSLDAAIAAREGQQQERLSVESVASAC